jgi:hypothetical protein
LSLSFALLLVQDTEVPREPIIRHATTLLSYTGHYRGPGRTVIARAAESPCEKQFAHMERRDLLHAGRAECHHGFAALNLGLQAGGRKHRPTVKVDLIPLPERIESTGLR